MVHNVPETFPKDSRGNNEQVLINPDMPSRGKKTRYTCIDYSNLLMKSQSWLIHLKNFDRNETQMEKGR